MATPSIHASPSKPSYARTYDSALVSREMHRLGNIPPPITPAPSTSALPPPPQPALPATSSADPWGALHVHVLPLFNGEPLRIPIEDLNVLVKRHIQSVVSSAPSKALSTLETDASDLIASGMVTLNAKLIGIDDEKLIPRVVEIWGFFWDQVLTYIEGVLLPLQTDNLILSLSRTHKPHTHLRATSPTRQPTSNTTTSASNYHIDVRSVALRSFRDKVILPLSQRLYQRLASPARHDSLLNQEVMTYQGPRLQQMLLVLTSQRRPHTLTFSLTSRAPTPTPGEQAITDLLRIIRAPLAKSNPEPRARPRPSPPNFLSGGVPRDRRGWVVRKQLPASGSAAAAASTGGRIPRLPASLILGTNADDDDDVFGGGGRARGGEETPRGGSYAYGYDLERERERVLEALRSPDIDSTTRGGGWGLGEGGEDARYPDDLDDDRDTYEDAGDDVARDAPREEDKVDDHDVLEREIKDYLGGMTAPPSQRRAT